MGRARSPTESPVGANGLVEPEPVPPTAATPAVGEPAPGVCPACAPAAAPPTPCPPPPARLLAAPACADRPAAPGSFFEPLCPQPAARQIHVVVVAQTSHALFSAVTH